MKEALVVLIAISALLLLLFLLRPSLTSGSGGRALAFIGLFLLPALALGLGGVVHLEPSKTTEFCLSCHEMEPYGESLWLADTDYLPAGHVQNRRVPQEVSCYSCHTDYTMYGDGAAKWRGVRHLWVHYAGPIPETIELYAPFKNRECLACHGGARTFEEGEIHLDVREDLATEEMSCLECHDLGHAIADLPDLERWSAPSAFSEGGAP